MSLKADIRRYILANEKAAETAEGVTRVWLKQPHCARVLAQVEQALDELVDEGLLERHALPGGASIYRRARRDEDNEQ